MTTQEQIKRMRLLLLNDKEDNSKDDLFEIFLDGAKAVVLNTLFPFDKNKKNFNFDDFRLKDWQVRCAMELYKSSQRDGIESYSENGFSVTYLASKISPDLYRELVPKAGCPLKRRDK